MAEIKSPVSIKYPNLHSFKEGVILLCPSILERKMISQLPWLNCISNPFKQKGLCFVRLNDANDNPKR